MMHNTNSPIEPKTVEPKIVPLEQMSSQELLALGLSFNDDFNYDDAIKHINAASMRLYMESDTPSKFKAMPIIAAYHYCLANQKNEQESLPEALIHFGAAQEKLKLITETTNDTQDLNCRIMIGLGITHLKLENYNNAVDMFFKALSLANELKQVKHQSTAQSYYGLALALSGKLIDGISTLKEARKHYPEHLRESSLNWALHRYHMGLVYELAKKPSDSFVELRESHRLIKQITQKSNSRINSHLDLLAHCHEALGRYYLTQADIVTAMKYYTKCFTSFNELAKPKEYNRIQTIITNQTQISRIQIPIKTNKNRTLSSTNIKPLNTAITKNDNKKNEKKIFN